MNWNKKQYNKLKIIFEPYVCTNFPKNSANIVYERKYISWGRYYLMHGIRHAMSSFEFIVGHGQQY